MKYMIKYQTPEDAENAHSHFTRSVFVDMEDETMSREQAVAELERHRYVFVPNTVEVQEFPDEDLEHLKRDAPVIQGLTKKRFLMLIGLALMHQQRGLTSDNVDAAIDQFISEGLSALSKARSRVQKEELDLTEREGRTVRYRGGKVPSDQEKQDRLLELFAESLSTANRNLLGARDLTPVDLMLFLER